VHVRRLRTSTRVHRRALAGVLAAAVTLGACTTHPAPLISARDLQQARAFKKFTVYWAGRLVDGVPLTAADNLYNFNSSVGYAMYYGDCEGRGTFHTAGCTLPLKITTVIYEAHSNASLGIQHNVRLRSVPAVIFGGGDDIEIYTDRQAIDIVADSPHRALAAVAALEPFNRTPTRDFPAFPQPYFQPGLTQQQLDAQAGAAPTGTTGATSDIAPPAALEPSPTPQD
jgi:hypothetical protein